jgi:hypothetical protein
VFIPLLSFFILSASKDEDVPRMIRPYVRVWIPAFAGKAVDRKPEIRKQGPHPTLSHGERAKKEQ